MAKRYEIQVVRSVQRWDHEHGAGLAVLSTQCLGPYAGVSLNEAFHEMLLDLDLNRDAFHVFDEGRITGSLVELSVATDTGMALVQYDCYVEVIETSLVDDREICEALNLKHYDQRRAV